MICHICKKEINHENSDTYVILKLKNEDVHVCTRHNGVMKEYDNQLKIQK